MKISATKIEILMAKKKISVSELAERSGMARQNVSVVKGRGTCNPLTAQKLADGLGVDVTEIMETEE